ncbi:MAG: hypothetical protein AAB673_02115, partial [Patescibacteria group bacterium]
QRFGRWRGIWRFWRRPIGRWRIKWKLVSEIEILNSKSEIRNKSKIQIFKIQKRFKIFNF